MSTARNPISDLQAIAAMPGLEYIADAIAPWCPRGTDPVALLIYIAGQWPWNGRAQLTSALRTTPVWELARQSAEQVGRDLPTAPPSHDQLRHVRDRARGGHSEHELGAALASRFPLAARDVVDAIGMLPVDAPRFLHRPHRSNTIYADGSVVSSPSDVTTDSVTGEVRNSRSRNGRPRITKQFRGKKGNDPKQGFPVLLVGAHSGTQRERVVLQVATYFDRNELGCAQRTLDQVIGLYGSRIHAVIYDRLMDGATMQHLMRLGVIPIVDMRNAKHNQSHVPVPLSMQTVLGTGAKPKERALLQPLETLVHPGLGFDCTHHLWALDGAVVATRTPKRPTLDDCELVEQTDLRFVEHNGEHSLIGTYRVPCQHGSLRYRIELSGDRYGSNGSLRAMADIVRPIDITAALGEIRGRRSDAENGFSAMKNSTHRGRARSYRTDDFLIDVVGYGLAVNAVAWDIHGAQHTNCGKAQYKEHIRSGW